MYFNDKPNEGVKDQKANDDSLTSRLYREAELLASLPQGAYNEASKHIQENRGSLLAEAGIGFVMAAGMAAAAKNPAIFGKAAAPLVRTGMETMGRIAGVSMALDVTSRVAMPMADAWSDRARLEDAKARLAYNVGTGFVDYGAMGLAGLAGARVGLKITPEWENLAPKFDHRSTLKPGELGRDAKDAHLYTTKRETVLNEDVADLYLKSFPKEELQPIDDIRDLINSGRIVSHATRDIDGKLHAMSLTSMHDETYLRFGKNREPHKFANLDYIAVQPDEYSKGFGSTHLRRLANLLRGERPDLLALTLEMESPTEAGISAAELARRNNRVKFYDPLGARNTEINYNIIDFEDPSYRGPSHLRAIVFDTEKFNAVRAGHTFMIDEGGYQLPRTNRAVREFDRNNNYWEQEFGPNKAAMLATPLSVLTHRGLVGMDHLVRHRLLGQPEEAKREQ